MWKYLHVTKPQNTHFAFLNHANIQKGENKHIHGTFPQAISYYHKIYLYIIYTRIEAASRTAFTQYQMISTECIIRVLGIRNLKLNITFCIA